MMQVGKFVVASASKLSGGGDGANAAQSVMWVVIGVLFIGSCYVLSIYLHK